MAAKRVIAKKTTTPRAPRVVKPKPDEAGVPLHAYVPDPSVHERYVRRQVFGVWDGVIASIAMEESQNMLLMGDTGSGKTLFGEAFASYHKLPYYSLPCDVSIDPSSLFGRMQPTEQQGVFVWQDGPVTQIARHGGVLNISEVNFMTPKIAASTYPLLDGRRYIPLLANKGEIVRAHLGKGKCWCSERNCDNKRVLVIADMNPLYRGTMELNAAFKNRFDIKLPWGYDNQVEESLVNFPTLRNLAEKLRASDDVVTPVSTNMLMEFEKFSLNKRLGIAFAKQNFMAAFESDEQQPIQHVFNLAMTDLEKDLAHFGAGDDEDLEEIEFVQEAQ